MFFSIDCKEKMFIYELKNFCLVVISHKGSPACMTSTSIALPNAMFFSISLFILFLIFAHLWWFGVLGLGS